VTSTGPTVEYFRPRANLSLGVNRTALVFELMPQPLPRSTELKFQPAIIADQTVADDGDNTIRAGA